MDAIDNINYGGFVQYNKIIKEEGSIRKAALKLGLTKSKLMVLAKKELGLCTATTSCKNQPKTGCTRCEEHLIYAFRTQNRERRLTSNKDWYLQNKAKKLEYQKVYQKNNRDKVNTLNRKYAKTEKGRAVNTAKRAYRRALQKAATPKWVDKAALKAIYKSCPKGFHVDHIIPLDNELVCGLHVPWNLQILSAFENDSKSNKWDGTYENESWRNDLKKKAE